MKSIVEEASSIAKAIENGWVRAGKPQEFTVRIFEEAEKNFLGFIKKPAKIGLFYKEPPIQQPGKGKDIRRQQVRPLQKSSPERVKPEQRPQQEKKQDQVIRQQQQTSSSPAQEPKQPKWTPDLIEGSKEWVNTMLKTINQNTPYTVETKHYYLTIRFASSVVHDKRKEQLLFKNWSYLLLQALRHKFKRGLRGYKIIITRAA